MRNAKLNRVTGNAEPPDVAVYMETGVQWLRMARNAARDTHDNPDGTSQDYWEWDELCIPSDLTEEQARDDFDGIWYAGSREAMADDEWRDDVESALLDLMEIAVGGGEL